MPFDLPTWLSYALAAVAAAGMAVGVSAAFLHAVLTKREVRAALGWGGLILVFPVAGAVLYLLFGINRIQRRATALRGAPTAGEGAVPSPPDDAPLAGLAHLVQRLVARPLLGGNRVRCLVDGEQAYPAMLEAIAGARRTVSLSTYIFDNDRVGRRFRDALAAAVERGVEVRVILDAVGARYSFPPISAALTHRGVPTAVFLRTLIPWRMPYMNLRTHRKILVVDGRAAFVGGMNLRRLHEVTEAGDAAVQDLHFRLDGPVVEQIQEVFAADWHFCRGEELTGDGWFPELEPLPPAAESCGANGIAEARVIPDGPNGDLDKLRWTLLGAVASARRSLRIVTPYFLPDTDLQTALQVAALRGVEVEILLPQRNNLALVAWAATAQLPWLLRHGCRVCLTPPPFDHSKLMLVDGAWALIGSANWDPRSLRLNFEINVELYGETTVARLEEIFAAKKATARELTLDDLRARPWWMKLRDGLARLAQPYL
jgi:cardiolipin synthase